MRQSREDSIAQDVHGNIQALPFAERAELVRILALLSDDDVGFMLNVLLDYDENYHPELDHCYETVRSAR